MVDGKLAEERTGGEVLAAERRSRLVAAVRNHGSRGVAELAAALGVSEMTVRRDIDALARTGRIDKIRGGAAIPQVPDQAELGFAAQTRRMIEEKRAIGRAAAAMVEPGMSIGISGGSTAWEFARAVREIPDVTIVTNSLPVSDVFARPDRVDEPYTQTVVVTGGVRTSSHSLVGPVAVASLEALHCDIVFLGVSGIDLQAGLTASNLLEAETERALIDAGRQSVVLADHTKWSAVGLTTIADIDGVDRIVIDDGLDEEARRVLEGMVEFSIATREVKPAEV